MYREMVNGDGEMPADGRLTPLLFAYFSQGVEEICGKGLRKSAGSISCPSSLSVA